MAVAHLRNGDTRTRLAAGFEVSVVTVWRDLRDAVDLLAACADDLTAVQGDRGTVWTPFKRRRTRLSRRQESSIGAPRARFFDGPP